MNFKDRIRQRMGTDAQAPSGGLYDREGERSLHVEKLSEATVSAVEDALTADLDPERTPTFDFDIESNDVLMESHLEDLLRGLQSGLDTGGIQIDIRPDDGACGPYHGDPDLPVYASPENWFDEVAYADACFAVESWLQLNANPDLAPGSAILRGIDPGSLERLRAGIRDGDTIPRGAVEFERVTTGPASASVFKDQEGRNRGVAALLEGIDRVAGRIVLRR